MSEFSHSLQTWSDRTEPIVVEAVIHARALSKHYPVSRGAGDLFRALVYRSVARGEVKVALDNVDLSVRRGEGMAIVGRNGSGKTTLLKILSGALSLTAGDLRVDGRIASLIDLEAGIDPNFSGRENAILLAVLSGVSRSRAQSLQSEIREFSGLGDAFENPVRTYSAGMSLRLAFAAAVVTEPDILLIDEVLAVGDAFFRQRCLRRIRQLQEAGCTTVLATHDPAAAISFCDQAIWLDHGQVAACGDPSEVMREYLGAQYADGAALDAVPVTPGSVATNAASDAVTPAPPLDKIDGRHGDGRAEVIGMALRDEADKPVSIPRPGQLMRVVITVRCNGIVAAPIVGFSLRDGLGEIITATNTAHEGRALPALNPDDRISIEFGFRWPAFASGMFSFSPAIADGKLDCHVMNDWVDNVIVVETENLAAPYGRLALEMVTVRCGLQSENES